MQADSSLEESKVVSEPPKSRPDYTLAVRRRELRFKNHHPDPRTSRYGQRLVEEILGCRMSGWLTPKLECNKKLQVIPPPSHPPPEATWPVWSGRCPGAIPRGARFGSHTMVQRIQGVGSAQFSPGAKDMTVSRTHRKGLDETLSAHRVTRPR